MWRKTYQDENRVGRAPDGGENDVGADVKGVFHEDHQAQAMRVVLSDGDGVFHVVSGGCSELSTAEELVFAEGVDEVVEEVDGWSVDGREEIVLWVKPLELEDLNGINEGEGAEEGGGVPGAPRPGFGIMDSDELDVGAGGVLEPVEDGVVVGVFVD